MILRMVKNLPIHLKVPQRATGVSGGVAGCLNDSVQRRWVRLLDGVGRIAGQRLGDGSLRGTVPHVKKEF